jgi:hypothetical protein
MRLFAAPQQSISPHTLCFTNGALRIQQLACSRSIPETYQPFTLQETHAFLILARNLPRRSHFWQPGTWHKGIAAMHEVIQIP